jgi:cysteine desulfurase
MAFMRPLDGVVHMFQNEVYLDNAATAKPYPEVVQAVCDAMSNFYGNSSAQHARGVQARKLLEESRSTIAEALEVQAAEVYFTSGGTESNNLALVGACKAARSLDAQRNELVLSAVEHASVTKTSRGLKREGWKVHYVRAKDGNFAMDVLRSRLNEHTAIVSVMSVQNEVGFCLPVREVVCAKNEIAPGALVHTDAVQAFGKIAFYPSELGVDLASISAHKIGGPQGIGALYVREGTPMYTTAFGGGQERGLRSGTQAIPLIAGFAKAVEITMAHRAEKESQVAALKSLLVAGVRDICPDVRINSRDDGSPYIVSFSVPGMDNDAALAFLDENGVRVSKASACETLHPNVPEEDWRTKHPMSLQLAGVPKNMVESTLRISFSAQSTKEDADAFLQAFREFMQKE